MKENGKEVESSSDKLAEEVTNTSTKMILATSIDTETITINPVVVIIEKVEEVTVEDKKNEELEKIDATGEFTSRRNLLDHLRLCWYGH